MPETKRATKRNTKPLLVRLELDQEAHQEVRIAAAIRGVSMARLAREAVTKEAKEIIRQNGK